MLMRIYRAALNPRGRISKREVQSSSSVSDTYSSGYISLVELEGFVPSRYSESVDADDLHSTPDQSQSYSDEGRWPMASQEREISQAPSACRVDIIRAETVRRLRDKNKAESPEWSYLRPC